MQITFIKLQSGGPGEGLLSLMAYTRRLRPKRIPFQASGILQRSIFGSVRGTIYQ